VSAGQPARARDAVLEVRNLSVEFALPTVTLRPVDDVSLSIYPGDVYALVGESGCGKSTLAGALLNLVPEPGVIAGGDILLRGRSVPSMTGDELRRTRMAEVAMVFQAAMSSFNPVVKIGRQVEHVLEAHPEVWPDRRAGLDYFDHLLDLVRLPASQVRGSFESQLSGGMKQRVAIAFACVLKPSVLVLDEPTTALDVINQRLVIEVLQDLRESLGVTIIFVTHDLSVVAELATTVGVMYAGRMVQVAPIDTIFYDRRRHPYVRALLSSIPNVLRPGRTATPIPGQVPRLDRLPPGCRFAPRCSLAEEVCRQEDPELIEDGQQNSVACHPLNQHLAAGHAGQERMPAAQRRGGGTRPLQHRQVNSP
jgi:peptide/nickel transport system ATP-binding protein